MIILPLLGLLTSSFLVQVNAPSNHVDSTQSRHHKTQAASPERNAHPPVSVEESEKPDVHPQQNPSCQKSDQSKKDALDYTFWALIINGILTLITLAIAVAGILQAGAAKRSASALVGIERAWIMVSLEESARTQGGGVTLFQSESANEFKIGAAIICENKGHSPAWIIEARARVDVVDSLPKKPSLDSKCILDWSPYEPILPEGQMARGWSATCEKARNSAKLTVLYGIVNYRDVFGVKRSTTFGYHLMGGKVGGKALMRLSGEYPNYNKHT